MKHLFLAFLALLFLSCNAKHFGTNTGNPEVPAPVNSQPGVPTYAQYLVTGLCQKIYQCVGQINTTACKTQLFYSSRMTSELGPKASLYSTEADLAAAESAGQILPVPSKFDICISAVNLLDCSDPLMLQAYSTEIPTDFSMAYMILRTSSACAQIY